MTMAETWMGGRQQKEHELYGTGGSGTDSRLMRSSLGQLIERSISAPPSSDSYDDSSHNRLMNGVSFDARI